MSSQEKETAMETFRRGETDVLVATTVIEVGVDVPNATMMVVLDADRFGIATQGQGWRTFRSIRWRHELFTWWIFRCRTQPRSNYDRFSFSLDRSNRGSWLVNKIRVSNQE
jgi:hypothetical protein